MTDAHDGQNAAGRQHPAPLRLSRTFKARRETVFNAWSTAEHVRNWFSPRTYSTPDATVDMRAGGAFDVCMCSPAGERQWVRGTFVEVTPHTRLVIDMHAMDAQDRPLFRAYTEVDFTDAPGGGTTIHIVQTYTFLDPAMAAPMVAGASEGWRTTLDKLEQEVGRMSDAAATDGQGSGGTALVSTCLWFEHDAETAVRLYVSLVPDSAIGYIQRAPAAWPGGAAGDAILVNFRLAGQNFQALNGGTRAEYGMAASISVQCAGQPVVDHLWAALTADGGSEIMCGWLRDRWGVPWQIVPDILPRLLAHPDPAVSARVFAAMQGMVKLDAAALQRAAAA